MKFHVDSWDPSYGAAYEAAEDGPTAQSSAEVDLTVERAAGGWEPLTPDGAARAPDLVQFVDGVRRIDATLWIEHTDAAPLPGLAASYAAGVVRCDLRQGRADVTAARVERGIFCATAAGAAIGSGIWAYPVRPVDATDLVRLSTAVQPSLSSLEEAVSAPTREEEDLLVFDGPLRNRSQIPRAVGYVKTHTTQYLPAEQAAVVTRLRPGQRTPVFRLGTSWHRHTWYLRLPGPAGSPWAGIVRLEASADLGRKPVIELADRTAVTLPRFASAPYKDPRAPQNLIPIAGLEGRLRRMLGDARLLLRSLTLAAGV